MRLNKNPIPFYYQLELILRKRILSGKIKPLHALPTEKDLCEEFGISRTPVRQALLALEIDGLIRREQGRETFVTKRGSRITSLNYTA